jgi:hypothetical protein
MLTLTGRTNTKVCWWYAESKTVQKAKRTSRPRHSPGFTIGIAIFQLRKKASQIEDGPQFGNHQVNQKKLLAHRRTHQQGTNPVRKRKYERKYDDSSEDDGDDCSVGSCSRLQTFL